MIALIALIALMALIGDAAAQETSYDAHGRALAASDGDARDPLWAFRPERQLSASFGGSAVLSFSDAPLVRMTTDGPTRTRERILDDLLGLSLSGQAALHERVAVGLSVPLWLTSTSDAGRAGPALGDLRVSVPVGVVLPDEDGAGFGLSVIPLADLPTGSQGRWLGDGVPGVGGLVAAGYGQGALQVTANVGAMTAPKLDAQGLAGGAHLLADLGAGYALQPETIAHLEARFDPSFATSTTAGTGSPAELALSVRHLPEDGGLGFTGGASSGLSRGVGAATFRLFAGISYARKAWPEPDTDGDGLVDSLDACPLKPELVNGWKDEDGCPDQLATVQVLVVDTSDPIADAAVLRDDTPIGQTSVSGELLIAELMPATHMSLSVTHPTHKSSEKQELDLVEGKQTVRVALDWAPGQLVVDVVDATTGERVPASIALSDVEPAVEPVTLSDQPATWTLPMGQVRVLVQAEGYGAASQTAEVLPAGTTTLAIKLQPALVQVEREEIKILEQVLFDFDKATIRPESDQLLREVAATILAHPELRRIEVHGHTDSDGDDAYNVELSQRRVDAVVAVLIERGVDAARLEPIGFGESKPIVPNDTEAHKAQNRRVQFVIVEQEERGDNGLP